MTGGLQSLLFLRRRKPYGSTDCPARGALRADVGIGPYENPEGGSVGPAAEFFNSAAATPAVIFPVLTNLAQKHLKKLSSSNRGLSISYEKQLTELFSKFDGTEYPARMNLPQQGSFQLGYYHQTQARYQKKEEKEHV